MATSTESLVGSSNSNVSISRASSSCSTWMEDKVHRQASLSSQPLPTPAKLTDLLVDQVSNESHRGETGVLVVALESTSKYKDQSATN